MLPIPYPYCSKLGGAKKHSEASNGGLRSSSSESGCKQARFIAAQAATAYVPAPKQQPYTKDVLAPYLLQVPAPGYTLRSTCQTTLTDAVELLESGTENWELLISAAGKWSLYQRPVEGTEVRLFRIEVALPPAFRGAEQRQRLYDFLRTSEGAKTINPDIEKYVGTTLDSFEGHVELPNARGSNQPSQARQGWASGPPNAERGYEGTLSSNREGQRATEMPSSQSQVATATEPEDSTMSHTAVWQPATNLRNNISAHVQQTASNAALPPAAPVAGDLRTQAGVTPAGNQEAAGPRPTWWRALLVRAAAVMGSLLALAARALGAIFRPFRALQRLTSAAEATVDSAVVGNGIASHTPTGVQRGPGGVEGQEATDGGALEPQGGGHSLHVVDTGRCDASLESQVAVTSPSAAREHSASAGTTAAAPRGFGSQSEASGKLPGSFVEAKLRFTELDLPALTPRYQHVAETYCPELHVYASSSARVGREHVVGAALSRVEVGSVVHYCLKPRGDGLTGEGEGNVASHSDVAKFVMVLYMELGGVIPPMVQNRIVARQFLVGMAGRLKAAARKLETAA